MHRIEALGEREAGWNGYDAKPPDTAALDFADTWLTDLYRRIQAQGDLWRSPHVTSSAEGEVVFEWWNGTRKLIIYCTATEASYVKVWGPDMVTQMGDGDATSPESREALWSWLTDPHADA